MTSTIRPPAMSWFLMTRCICMPFSMATLTTRSLDVNVCGLGSFPEDLFVTFQAGEEGLGRVSDRTQPTGDQLFAHFGIVDSLDHCGMERREDRLRGAERRVKPE